MKSSESIANLADALVKANLLIVNPTKTERVQAGAKRYSFAPLPELLDDLRPVLQAHGLALVQEAATEGVTTRFIHSSGEWLEFAPLSLPAGNDAQSWGSAITYARRYTLCAALGIAADEDDDGAKAKSKSKSASGGSGSHAPTLPSDGEIPPDASPSETEAQLDPPDHSTVSETSGSPKGVGEGPEGEPETSPAIGPGRDTPPGTDGGTSAIVHQHGSWSTRKPDGGAMRNGWVRCTNLLPNGQVCNQGEMRRRVNASDMLPEEAA